MEDELCWLCANSAGKGVCAGHRRFGIRQESVCVESVAANHPEKVARISMI